MRMMMMMMKMMIMKMVIMMKMTIKKSDDQKACRGVAADRGVTYTVV